RIQRHLHVTVIYVPHDQEEALSMSDRVAVMRAGRTEQIGTPADLYESPVSPFVADFVGESNFLDGVVVSTNPDGRALVRTVGGLELSGVSREPLSLGQRTVAAVRPGKIVPYEAPAAALNRGKIVLVGGGALCSVVLGQTGTLTVKVQNRLASRPLATGDVVELAWDAGDTRLFARAADEG